MRVTTCGNAHQTAEAREACAHQSGFVISCAILVVGSVFWCVLVAKERAPNGVAQENKRAPRRRGFWCALCIGLGRRDSTAHFLVHQGQVLQGSGQELRGSAEAASATGERQVLQ